MVVSGSERVRDQFMWLVVWPVVPYGRKGNSLGHVIHIFIVAHCMLQTQCAEQPVVSGEEREGENGR